MTKTQFKRKTLMMLKTIDIIKECERLFDSGGIDTKSYDDNYKLPKITLSVALENKVDSLIFPGLNPERENLKHF